jgi:hypothetical protein
LAEVQANIQEAIELYVETLSAVDRQKLLQRKVTIAPPRLRSFLNPIFIDF